eukprot:8805228-Lingulodinium_polyedra.AAC.1
MLSNAERYDGVSLCNANAKHITSARRCIVPGPGCHDGAYPAQREVFRHCAERSWYPGRCIRCTRCWPRM